MYGSAFINSGLEKITEEIQERLHRISHGWAADKAEAAAHVKHCDPACLALITAKGVLDVLGVRRIEQPTYAYVATHIGNLVHDQIILDEFEREHTELFTKAKLTIHAHKGYLYKVQRFRAAMRKADHSRRSGQQRSGVLLVGGWWLDWHTPQDG